MKSCRVAVVQAAPVAFDLHASIARLGGLLQDAAKTGAQLVLFPEAFLPGFPSGLDWGGASTGIRIPDGEAGFQRYFASAITVPSADTQAIGKMVAEAAIFAIIGVIERVGASLSCSVLHFDPTGALVHVRRKLMPTMAERTVWMQSDGSSLTVVESDIARIGTAICWENYMPLLRQCLYAQGVEIYCAPTADDLDTWISTMQHVAIEGRCFVLSSNQFTKRRDFPADYGDFPSSDPDFVVSRGGSCIVDPFGKLLAGPVYDQDALLVADLDAELVIKGKFSFDVVGHYARNDIFQLQVDRRQKPGVTFVNEQGMQPASNLSSPILGQQ